MAAQASSIRPMRSDVSASCLSKLGAKLRVFQLSAWRAACRSMTGPSAAMTIGGRGRCTGRGFIAASLTR